MFSFDDVRCGATFSYRRIESPGGTLLSGGNKDIRSSDVIQTAPELECESRATPQRSILVVDDDQDQVVSLALRLEKQGFRALTAHAGRTCLTVANEERPNLIILDLGLPDLDGLEVCELLADSPRTCTIPIIILSGRSRDGIVRSSRAAGCRYFVHKPYDPNALLALIENSIAAADEEWS